MCMSGALDVRWRTPSALRTGSGNGEPMQSDELGLGEARAGVTSGQDKGNGDGAAAPGQDQLLTPGKDVLRDAVQATDGTALNGVHAGIVEAQIDDGRHALQVYQSPGNCWKVLVCATDQLAQMLVGRCVGVERIHGDVELPDARVAFHQ
jgi:hypothetical protein